jgi:putative membrane protein
VLLEGSHALGRLFRLTFRITVPLAALSYGALWASRLMSHGPAPLLYAKIGYVLSAISIFLAFRVNQAYGRWWEARQLWGKLINESRSWGRLVVTHFALDPRLRRTLVMRQVAYVNMLRIALRHGAGDEGRALMKAQMKRLLPEEEASVVDRSNNVPTQLLVSQAADIEQALGGSLESRQVWTRMTDVLSTITAAQGGCERIKKTVFPAGITHFTRFMVWALAPLMTFAVLGSTAAYDEIELPVVVIITAVFVVMEQLARDLQTPFDNGPDDTPMSAICVTIETELRQMLGDGELPEEVLPVRGVLM